MNALYLSAPILERFGACLRPGGLTITRRFLHLAPIPVGGTILDAGCGSGATIAFLKQQGFSNVFGIDREETLLHAGGTDLDRKVQADCSNLPLVDQSVDLIISECAWNLTDRQQAVAEFARIARPGARLCLSDIYNRACTGGAGAKVWPVPSCLTFATGIEKVRSLLIKGGFTIEIEEDHTPLLNRAAAEFVFEYGSLHGFWEAVTGDADLARMACRAGAKTRPGLFLIIARRENSYERVRC